MPNQYVNKVVRSDGTTLIDITPTTATAADVASGKVFFAANGAQTLGTGSGGSSSGQTKTGTVTGDGTTTLQIPCSFKPDLIYVYADMSDTVSNMGVISVTIIKDELIDIHSDTSSSADSESLLYISHDVTGYNENDASSPHASYSNGTLTIDMVANSTSTRFLSGEVYTYKLSTVGTGSGGSANVDTKTITINGTYDAGDDSLDGYSEVTVNVQGGASMTEVANTYGTELIISSASSSTPSVTRHTLYFEYEDETTETVYVYYDDALIGSAITATTPTTHNNKTVTSAQLDSVEWYSYTPTPTPSGDWTTIYDGTITTWGGETNLEALAGGSFTSGETYRVTVDGDAYVCTVEYLSTYDMYYIGNINIAAGTDDGTGIPVLCYYQGSQWLKIHIRNGGDNVNHTFKLERQVSA